MLYLHTNIAGERQILYITDDVVAHMKLYIARNVRGEGLFIQDMLSGKFEFFTSEGLKDVLQDSTLLG